METAQHGTMPTRWESFRVWLLAHPYSILVMLLFVGLGVPFYLRHFSEFDENYVLAARHLWNGQDMYLSKDGYLYPPFMAWLSVPFVFLPQAVGRMLFYLVSFGCGFFLCRWAWILSGGGKLEGARSIPRSEHLIVLLGLVCAGRFVADGLSHQQTDPVIGCLVLGGCLALSRSRALIAATAFGLAAAMKCTALLFCPFLLWQRRWLAAGWLIAVALGANLLPNLVSSSPAGGWWLTEWCTRYFPFRNADHVPGNWGSDIVFNQSLAGLANRFSVTQWVWTKNAFEVRAHPEPMSAGMLRGLVYGSDALLLLAALAVLAKRARQEGGQESTDPARPSPLAPAPSLEFSLVLTLMLLLSPMSSKPHFCTLLLPAFCLARCAIAGRQLAPALFLAMAILCGFMSTRDVWGDAVSTYSLWCGSLTWSTLALFAGCAYCLIVPQRAAAACSRREELPRAA
jgi:hypothetical protein